MLKIVSLNLLNLILFQRPLAKQHMNRETDAIKRLNNEFT